MKKADEYLKKALTNTHWNYLEHVMNSGRCYPDLIKAIKAAQIDAIDEAVKKCAENVEHKWDERTDTELFDIDKESILQVAEELKKELDDNSNNNKRS